MEATTPTGPKNLLNGENSTPAPPLYLAMSPPKQLRMFRNGEATLDRNSPPPQHQQPNYVVNYVINYDDLDIREHLGSGRYGHVSLAYLRSRNNIAVAVKQVKELGQEVEILSQLSHRNIVRFYGVYTRPPHFGIITEYCERGSLYDLLRKVRPRMSPNDDDAGGLGFVNILQWASDISRGMNYLHSEAPIQIIHRDLKSTNVLLSRDWMCKICDFGSSRTRNRDSSVITVAGTPAWMAPELIRGEANFNSRCDVWSFGVVLWELLTCEQPFKGLESYQIMFIVGSRSEHPPIPELCPEPFKELMTRCWEDNPCSRPLFADIVGELASMSSNPELSSELAEFTSASARREWLLEVEQELSRVKELKQSLEEREHMVSERERKIEEQKRIIDLHMSRLRTSSSSNQLNYLSHNSRLERLDVLNWTEAEVARWVRELDSTVGHFRGLGRYANLFEANHISGQRLLLLTKNDFIAMGITSLGHQKQFLDEIDFLRIASQMVVDFPPLQITSKDHSTIEEGVFELEQDVILKSQPSPMSFSSLMQRVSEEDCISAKPSTIPTVCNPAVEMLQPGKNYVVVENREFFVHLGVGMYTFPTTIKAAGVVKDAVEYRVFVDAHISFDPNAVTSFDEGIPSGNDIDLTVDMATVFSTVCVTLDPGLAGERKICAATDSSDVMTNSIFCKSAPYIAKESFPMDLSNDFKWVEVEISLRQPFCTKPMSHSASTFRTGSRSSSTPSDLFITLACDRTGCGADADSEKPPNSFEFVGVIRKRIPANFGGPLHLWTECVTQLTDKSDCGNSASQSLNLSLLTNRLDNPTISLSSSSCGGGQAKAVGSPRHLSLTSPCQENDPVQFYMDARRNSVTQVKSPIESRPSSPAAAMIGHQVKVASQSNVSYNNYNHSGGIKSYAAVAAAGKSSLQPPVHPSNHHHHHQHRVNGQWSSVSPAFRSAVRNSQRRTNSTTDRSHRQSNAPGSSHRSGGRGGSGQGKH